jgi:hypothetical protein
MVFKNLASGALLTTENEEVIEQYKNNTSLYSVVKDNVEDKTKTTKAKKQKAVE